MRKRRIRKIELNTIKVKRGRAGVGADQQIELQPVPPLNTAGLILTAYGYITEDTLSDLVDFNSTGMLPNGNIVRVTRDNIGQMEYGSIIQVRDGRRVQPFIHTVDPTRPRQYRNTDDTLSIDLETGTLSIRAEQFVVPEPSFIGGIIGDDEPPQRLPELRDLVNQVAERPAPPTTRRVYIPDSLRERTSSLQSAQNMSDSEHRREWSSQIIEGNEGGIDSIPLLFPGIQPVLKIIQWASLRRRDASTNRIYIDSVQMNVDNEYDERSILGRLEMERRLVRTRRRGEIKFHIGLSEYTWEFDIIAAQGATPADGYADDFADRAVASNFDFQRVLQQIRYNIIGGQDVYFATTGFTERSQGWNREY